MTTINPGDSQNVSGVQSLEAPLNVAGELNVSGELNIDTKPGISGIVTDSSNNPIENATVNLFLQDNGTTSKETTTDVNGAYSFGEHPDATSSIQTWHLIASHDDGTDKFFSRSKFGVRASLQTQVPPNAFPETATFWDNWTPAFDFAIGPQDRFVGVVETPDPTFAQDGTAISVKNSSANAQYTLDTVSPPLDFSGFSTLRCKIETENTSFRANETGQPMRFKINGTTVFTYTGNPDDKSGYQEQTFDISSAGANSTISLEGQVISTSHAGQTILRVGDLRTE